ncbi:MAG: class I SAM-dependent rRNA methyltransferase [Thermodesulfobacteriota bacterium]
MFFKTEMTGRGVDMALVRLKPKAERPVGRRHPWLFSGAVAGVEGDPGPGDLVRVVDAAGGFLAWGLYNPRSSIRVRLLEWVEEAAVDEAWWASRLERAVGLRRPLLDDPGLSACRLVFAESDGLPGLIADWYDGWVVFQALAAGVDRRKEFLAGTLKEITGARGVFERSDTESRALEGLNPAVGVLAGASPPERLEVKEGGLRFLVDPVRGQKTGFYIDQRPNRRVAAAYARDREVLDCFAYTFAFAAYCYQAGARAVVRVESSAEAAALGAANLALNGFEARPGETITADVFQVLRKFRDQGRRFDLIILDPPKLAPTKASVSKAARAYKDINLLALKLLRPGGILATFSCSGGVEADLFQKIVFGAALDAGREVQVLERMGQGPDHPVRLSFPESSYLKGLLGRAW